jgi:hypothetical protein
MSDNPLQNTAERDNRVRERAYHLWETDGRPHGRAQDYWERAEFLIGIEDSAGAGQLPNPQSKPEPIPGVTIEEAEIQDNYGEFPDRLTDQGARRQTPKARARVRTSPARTTRGDAS